jgi:hypothetical protein
MVRPRINQFADDMGITRSKAVKLINEGRRRSDGGSQTVEKHMGKMELPKARSKDVEYNMRFKEERAAHNRRKVEEEMKKDTENRAYGGTHVKKAMGGMCRGGGKAIQGMKYTGCK